MMPIFKNPWTFRLQNLFYFSFSFWNRRCFTASPPNALNLEWRERSAWIQWFQENREASWRHEIWHGLLFTCDFIEQNSESWRRFYINRCFRYTFLQHFGCLCNEREKNVNVESLLRIGWSIARNRTFRITVFFWEGVSWIWAIDMESCIADNEHHPRQTTNSLPVEIKYGCRLQYPNLHPIKWR